MHEHNTLSFCCAICQLSCVAGLLSCVQDPSGSMGAALHSSVLQQQAELGPGCVLLLQQVSVFTPALGTTYAAVTARNVVRVSTSGQQLRKATVLAAQHTVLCLQC
jgi:hypothetical protein